MDTTQMDLYKVFLKTASAPYEYTVRNGEPFLATPWITNDEFVTRLQEHKFIGTAEDGISLRFHSRPAVSGEFLLYFVSILSPEERTLRTILEMLRKVPKLDEFVETFRKLTREEKDIIYSENGSGPITSRFFSL